MNTVGMSEPISRQRGDYMELLVSFPTVLSRSLIQQSINTHMAQIIY